MKEQRNMARQPTINVSGCDPGSLLAKAMSRSSTSRLSSSVKLPMQSTTSRISLVGDNASLEPKVDVIYGTRNNAKGVGCFDRLLGVFYLARRTKSETFQTTTSAKPLRHRARENYLGSRSPWVLPVYVLSTQTDEHRHLIPKEAKCTIDTGNLQGNLVSRAFLVDVLGYSEADFDELAKEETDGGTGITGHRLVPEGAISLTWYHSNSTRVFRDMRFLISEHPIYDLIIGAHSIRENNILDVPNLMVDKDEDGITGNVISTENESLKDGLTHEKFEALEILENEVTKAEEIYMDSLGIETDAEVKEKLITFDKKKSEFHTAFRTAYELLISQAEANGRKRAAEELSGELRGFFPPKEVDQTDKDKNI